MPRLTQEQINIIMDFTKKDIQNKTKGGINNLKKELNELDETENSNRWWIPDHGTTPAVLRVPEELNNFKEAKLRLFQNYLQAFYTELLAIDEQLKATNLTPQMRDGLIKQAEALHVNVVQLQQLADKHAEKFRMKLENWEKSNPMPKEQFDKIASFKVVIPIMQPNPKNGQHFKFITTETFTSKVSEIKDSSTKPLQQNTQKNTLPPSTVKNPDPSPPKFQPINCAFYISYIDKLDKELSGIPLEEIRKLRNDIMTQEFYRTSNNPRLNSLFAHRGGDFDKVKEKLFDLVANANKIPFSPNPEVQKPEKPQEEVAIERPRRMGGPS